MREIKDEAKDILYMDEINHECTLLCPPNKQNGSARKSITFVFDRCYNATTNTAQVYNELPYSLVQVYSRVQRVTKCVAMRLAHIKKICTM